ncbi:hypothetical protein MKW92_039558 [Papaver armeniacum]|nr:hypothetical protein MKW92_039558 [Papaver armeniacum]
MLKVTVKESSIVKPAEETPKVCLWTSNIDQLSPVHVQTVSFYRRPASTCDFFNSTVLKDGLSKVLVTYYPMAGRLKRNEAGRAEIHCNGEGVIFIEAETDSLIEDLGDFTPNEQLMPLSPNPDYSNDISAYPPLLVQVTHFNHIVVGGVCGFNFINAWSDLCRGVNDMKSVPFFDRTVLRARDPPIVSFPHIEYNKPTFMNIPPLSKPKIAVAKLNISNMQASVLKSKCNKGEFRFSTYEVIAGHIWRCACKARELKDDQETVISIPLDCRSRSSPPLPDGYFGNPIFDLAPKAISGDIVSKPLSYAVNIIHETIKTLGNNEYLRSAIDYLELHPDFSIFKGGGPQSCNIRNVSWLKMPIYGADFGWGKPLYVGLGTVGLAGLSLLAPNPPGSDGGFSLIISLESDYHINLFKEYFYEDGNLSKL